MSPRKTILPDYHTVHLANGLELRLMSRTTVPLVNLKFLLRAGAAQDPPGKAGLAWLTAELLKKGSGNWSAARFAEEVEYLGGYLDARAFQDFTIISGQFMAGDLPTGLKLLKRMLREPTFAPAEFQSARDRLLAAIRSVKDNPSALNSLYFQHLFYGPGHPYGRPAHGLESTVSRITLEDIHHFYRQHYHAGNGVLVIVGSLEEQNVQTRVESLFGQWTEGPVAADPRIELRRWRNPGVFSFRRPGG